MPVPPQARHAPLSSCSGALNDRRWTEGRAEDLRCVGMHPVFCGVEPRTKRTGEIGIDCSRETYDNGTVAGRKGAIEKLLQSFRLCGSNDFDQCRRALRSYEQRSDSNQ